MQLILGIARTLFFRLLFIGILVFAVFWAWNNFKHKREARTFIVSFNTIEGLNKGAPIYSRGLRVGKVIDIFPLGNSNNIGIKGLITNKDFPAPKAGVSAEIVTDIEGGGGKILEIKPLIENLAPEIIARQKSAPIVSSGRTPFTVKGSMRLMKDFFQLIKDFGEQSLHALNSRQGLEYREQLGSAIDNTITSLEYNTVKQDVNNSIQELNQKIRDFETQPNKQAKVQRALEDQVRALRNTVGSFGTLAGVYKEE